MIKKRKELDFGDVYVDKRNNLLCIYVGCAIREHRESQGFAWQPSSKYYSYVVTDNYKTYVKKKSILHFLENNHNYTVEVCNITTSNYKVNVLYNIKENLHKYEVKKSIYGYDVVDCCSTKDCIRKALIKEKLRTQYFRQENDLARSLFYRS